MGPPRVKKAAFDPQAFQWTFENNYKNKLFSAFCFHRLLMHHQILFLLNSMQAQWSQRCFLRITEAKIHIFLSYVFLFEGKPRYLQLWKLPVKPFAFSEVFLIFGNVSLKFWPLPCTDAWREVYTRDTIVSLMASFWAKQWLTIHSSS